MEHYSPPYTITDEILALVASISEKLGRISTVHALETKPYLRRNNRIKSIHSSLRIEANSLSLGQVRDVLNGRLVLGEQKEIQEVKNASRNSFMCASISETESDTIYDCPQRRSKGFLHRLKRWNREIANQQQKKNRFCGSFLLH